MAKNYPGIHNKRNIEAVSASTQIISL